MAVTSIDVAMMGIRRRNFKGRTDKYAPWRASAQPVSEAVAKEGGFIDVIQDPALVNELYKETSRDRLNQYKQYVNFYNGKHYVQEFDDGEKKPIFNFSQMVVDKSVDFFVAKGFDIRAIEGNELVAKAFDVVWESNDKDNLQRKLALMGSITGDAFLYVTLRTKDDLGADLPKAKWSIVLTPIDPFFVFPVFSKTDPGDLDSVLIQYPIHRTETGAVSYKSVYISRTKYMVFEDDKKVEDSENGFGFVPVIHFPNYIDPVKAWGQSDLNAVVPMNEEYNIIAASVRKIIKYHAEPTTIIYGARASKLEKGAKKVWSGLPTDARVENLAFSSDLGATYKYMELLEQNIFKVANIPSALFNVNGMPAVSNTSGLAIRMMFQPLIDKTIRKKEAFTVSFRRVNRAIAKAFDLMGVDVAGLADNPNEILNLVPEFSDPLPFDEVAQLNSDKMKLDMGITSTAALLRKYNPGEDTLRLTVEVIADKMAALLTEAEKTILLQGGLPNLTVLFLSSLGISEDLTSLRDRAQQAYLTAQAARPASVPDAQPADKPATSDKPNA